MVFKHPYDESIRYLINAERLARMKSDALLANTNFGPTSTREALGLHAAANISGILLGYPAWNRSARESFLSAPLKAAPSIMNAKELKLFLH